VLGEENYSTIRENNNLKALIIVFSPTGNTNKVAEMLEKALLERNAEVQSIDMSREDVFSDAGKIRGFLEEKVLPHDCICVGGPVYAGHLQNQAKNIIHTLPSPGGKWGKLAIPFVTWGGISSGVALREAANLLKSSGRATVFGMKIVGRHSLARKYAVKLNEGKPGAEALPFAEELAERLLTLKDKNHDELIDISKTLDYQDPVTKVIDDFFFNETGLKLIFHPGLKVNPDKCEGCGLCVEYCPIQCWEMAGNMPVEKKHGADCFYCGECFNRCPTGAITFPAARMEWLITNGGRGKGPLACREFPKNAVYPLK